MKITQYADPEFLWFLLVLIPIIALYVYRTVKGGAAITISTAKSLENTPKGIRYYFRHLPFALFCVAVALLVFAIARPRNSETGSNTKTRGIDIVLALDASTSMLARDFEPDRIGAAKDVAAKFVADRPNDRMGIVVFAGESFTQSPLTTDKATLQTLLGQVRTGIVEDGTAIGSGLATAVNRLKESDAKSKVIILLTDGINNSGQIAPLTAAEIAKTYGIKVYTIGVGTRGMAPTPAYDIWGRMHLVQAQVEIDEEMLKEIARLTGGTYFRATDKATLTDVYDQINQMETTVIDSSQYTHYTELFGRFILWAVALLIAGFLVWSLWLRRIP